jgi:hypothetical protein
MNRGRREACTKGDTHGQPVIQPVHANSHGHYEYEYSSDEEDRGKVAKNSRYNQDYRMKVKMFFLVVI